MDEVLPLTLVGNTLGERHRCLNTLVITAYQQNVPIQSVLELPELNSIDRVFKIKLASKYRHLDFIIENLKEKDMLYVSLALKNTWMLDCEYRHIINPNYLESQLYPEMITTAVIKMKNFIEQKLKDPETCQEFYEYYKSDFDVAIKFLWHCSKHFIVEEVKKIIHKLTPKHLRILCEACPQVARVYFEGLENNKEARHRYLKDQTKYFNSILNVLRVNGDLFLDLIERYFDKSCLRPLSSSATKHIMKNFKNRYTAKPELYAAWLLHVKTLAKFLSTDEIKDIIIKLARARYLNMSFTYKDAEPFIKCLSAEERASIKKQIFVDKAIGTEIETWPYPAPENLQFDSESYYEPFTDIEYEPYEYDEENFTPYCGTILKRRVMKKYCKSLPLCITKSSKSSLDQLFDRYRFANFDKTFFEFRKLLPMEGTIEGRRNMMLVLVSKAGGNEVSLERLLKFLVERHSNEPVHLRDAVARSMVKRAFVWRLSSDIWELLLKWATTSVPEILHSKVLRHLLTGSSLSPADLAAYLLDYSDLTVYSLNADEKACIAQRLPTLLLSVNEPEKLLDTLKTYKLRVNTVPGAQDFLMSAARKDEDILKRLFKFKVARRHLLKESFRITQTDAAYVNALKHDISVLENGESFAALVAKEKPNHDKFLHALVLYFPEADGLAARHRVALEKYIDEEYCESFARPLAYLFNTGNKSFENYIEEVEIKSLTGPQRKFAAAVRANAFVVRPIIDIDVVNWQAMGGKFICNKVLLCSDKHLDANIQTCLTWKKTMRVALHLARRRESPTDVYAAVVRTRPMVAVKLVLSDIRKRTVDLSLWNQVKPVISNLDLSKTTMQHVKKSLGDYYLTTDIQADYWTTVYGAFYRASELEAMPMLCKMENMLTEVDENVLRKLILDFLRDKLNKDVISNYESKILCLYFRIIAKYLLMSESDQDQKARKETICDPFFDKIEILWHDSKDESKLIDALNDFLLGLKYSKAFINTKYVCCIPIFTNILERLHKILPRDRYFKKYVCIHLTMLYYRSIRQALKQKPEVFENPTSQQTDGVKLVGFILGKYISIEIQDLVHSYFRSIIDIYQRGLLHFFSEYFVYDVNRANLVMSTIRGLIEGGIESQLLAQHVIQMEHIGYVHKHEKDEIMKLLKDINNEEMKFFLYANINPY